MYFGYMMVDITLSVLSFIGNLGQFIAMFFTISGCNTHPSANIWIKLITLLPVLMMNNRVNVNSWLSGEIMSHYSGFCLPLIG